MKEMKDFKTFNVEMTIEKAKSILKKLKKELKEVKKGKLRKYYWIPYEENIDSFNFMVDQNLYVIDRFREDKEEEFNKIQSDELATKYGFNSKKQTDKQLEDWVKECNVVLPLDAYDIEYEIMFIENLIKESKKD